MSFNISRIDCEYKIKRIVPFLSITGPYIVDQMEQTPSTEVTNLEVSSVIYALQS